MRAMPRAGRTLLIVLAVLLLLAVAMGAWLFLAAPSRPSVDEGRAVADAFLARLRDGKADGAWDSTTADFKSFEGKENFRRRVAKTPSLKLPLAFVSTMTIAVGDQPRDEFLYQAKNGDKMATVRLLIAREDGGWKVDRMTAE